MKGQAVFQIEFNSAGRAQTVTVVKSTGHAILDKACIETFYQWQVKPNAFEKMIVPINFHMSGEEAAVLRRLRAHLVWAVAPVAPIDTRMHGIGGAGHFQLTIDPNTGRVTDIKIVKTMGDPSTRWSKHQSIGNGASLPTPRGRSPSRLPSSQVGSTWRREGVPSGTVWNSGRRKWTISPRSYTHASSSMLRA